MQRESIDVVAAPAATDKLPSIGVFIVFPPFPPPPTPGLASPLFFSSSPCPSCNEDQCLTARSSFSSSPRPSTKKGPRTFRRKDAAGWLAGTESYAWTTTTARTGLGLTQTQPNGRKTRRASLALSVDVAMAGRPVGQSSSCRLCRGPVRVRVALGSRRKHR